MKENRRINLVMAPLFLFIVIIGIALFFVRDRLMPPGIGHELSIGPETSSPLIATDQFLVLIHPSHIGKLSEILSPLGLELRFPLLNWIAVARKDDRGSVARLGSNQANLARLIVNSLLTNPLVLDAHHNFILEPTANEPWPGQHEWQLNNTDGKNPYALNLAEAWSITKGSKDVTIAVVDDFSIEQQFSFATVFPNCAARVSFFSPIKKTTQPPLPALSPHGEPLLQALGACNNVPPFSSGIDHAAKIVAAEPATRSHADVFLTALLAGGIDVCATSVVPCPANSALAPHPTIPDVMLLPLGNSAPELMQISADMVDALKAKNVIIVTGAGNDHTNANSFFPGASPHVINVGAMNKNGRRAQFSNWGFPVDILAPGDEIDIAYPNGLKEVSGTSIAAAYTAGTVALLKAIKSDLSFEEARHTLLYSAHKLTCEEYCNDDERCRETCCNHHVERCDKRALNPTAALRALSSPSKAVLKLDQSYFLYLRDEPYAKEILVQNVGGANATVTVTAFDEHVDIAPKNFVLKTGNNEEQSQILKVSFKREPFTRQIFKFEISARQQDTLVDRTEFYVEYVPRR